MTVEFRPAPPDTGVVFVRSDLSPAVRIPADVSHRVEVPRRTVLSHGGGSVEMVEHVLAALAGLQIDNRDKQDYHADTISSVISAQARPVYTKSRTSHALLGRWRDVDRKQRTRFV